MTNDVRIVLSNLTNITVKFIILFHKIFYQSTPTTQDDYNVTLFTAGHKAVFKIFN